MSGATPSPDHLAPYGEQRAVRFLGRSPDGVFEVWSTERLAGAVNERAAVWNAQSGALAWFEPGVSHIAWTTKRDRILVARETYEPLPKRPTMPGTSTIILSPVQSEFTHTLELRSWPDGAVIASIDLEFPMGWPFELRVAPECSLAIVGWQDQCEHGWEFVDLDAESLTQRDGAGIMLKRWPASELTFSPDGASFVAAFGSVGWWSDDDPDDPSPGGRRTAGAVVHVDLECGAVRTTELHVTVPAAWLPENTEDDERLIVPSQPVYRDDGTIVVELPIGVRHVVKPDGSVATDGLRIE